MTERGRRRNKKGALFLKAQEANSDEAVARIFQGEHYG
jgi:hypothetical protein